MVHQYKLNGINIVLDTFSGAIHTVDDVAYDMIEMYKTKGEKELISELLLKYKGVDGVDENELEECLDDIKQLENSGKLFTQNGFKNDALNYKNTKNDIKALCLHVAHTCNLNCSYCFAAQGKYKGETALMSFEVGKKALDFLFENSGTHKNLDVDFFGGEPLMNWENVKKLVAYARQEEVKFGKNTRFTLTTNGVLLDDDVMDFANEHMHNVVLSLDGRKHVHDRLRKDYQGNGSYDKIVPKFKEFAKKRGQKDYYMRGTFTHANTDFTNDIIHMADLGFDRLSMEPVVCDDSDEAALTKQDLPILKNQYEALALEMIKREKNGNPFIFYHYMLDLKNGPCVYKRIAGCGSGVEYMAVTPNGDLYPCHRFVGDDEFKLGSVFDGVQNTKVRDGFRSCNVYSKKECEDCWASMYCSGGCAANSYYATGDINGIYEYGCELFKKRIECAIMVKIAQGNV